MPLLSIIENSSLVAMSVLLVLLLFSVMSWAIIFFKLFQVGSALRTAKRFADMFWQLRNLDAIAESARRHPNNPAARVFLDGYQEALKSGGKKPGAVERVLHRGSTRELVHLERMVHFLATIGSTSPFIGLFGTVVGIMNSFNSIGTQGSASLATVAPGIAESLVATAAGLIAAIPAVIAYNYFSSRINQVSSELEHLSDDFMSMLGDK